MSSRDTLFNAPLNQISAFRFDHRVADVFPDMIRRSVPGYESVIEMTGVLAADFYREGTVCYDLGCSLGASTLSVLQKNPSVQIIGIDNSPDMLKRCQSILDEVMIDTTHVELRCQNIEEAAIENTSFVILNYTLQFIPPEKRQPLLQRIYEGLIVGGALLVTEKISFSTEDLQALMTRLHHDFKQSQGYSLLEISQKRTSIENVLIPETLDTHMDRLRDVGFSSVSPWFQCLNFCSILAIR